MSREISRPSTRRAARPIISEATDGSRRRVPSASTGRAIKETRRRGLPEPAEDLVERDNIYTGITEEDRHPSGLRPVKHNVVATVALGDSLPLMQIAMRVRNAEYSPKRFAAVIMKLRAPKCTALVFASGKMVVTGAKSITEAKRAGMKFRKIIQKTCPNIDIKFRDFTIQNMVASADVRFPIRLEGISGSHQSAFSTYEPEVFPGLIYRMYDPIVTLLIFVSGKVVLTGAKTDESIEDAFDKIYPLLSEFRKL
eukprot:Clim_evm55s153 gene=Clim_evmTU55s153